jgi:hypothetical protein
MTTLLGIPYVVCIGVNSLVWWFAVVSPSRDTAVILEYRTRAACEVVRRAYDRAGRTVTTCQEKGRAS